MRLLIVVLGILLAAPAATACSCSYAGPFTTTMHQMPLVVRVEGTGYGKKLSHGETLYSTMKVDVVEVLKGELDVDELVVRGDPGHLCLEYINSDKFVVGNEVLLALYKVTKKKVDLVSCGEHSVVIVGDTIRGREYVRDDEGRFLREEFYSIPLKIIREQLKEAEDEAKAQAASESTVE